MKTKASSASSLFPTFLPSVKQIFTILIVASISSLKIFAARTSITSASSSRRFIRATETSSSAGTNTAAFVPIRGGEKGKLSETITNNRHLPPSLFASTNTEKVSQNNSSNMNVAIIGGGGAAGLAAIRVLSRNPHLKSKILSLTVLEKENNIGGIWHHRENDEAKPMYRGLRTNLPRELMAFREKPWGSDGVGDSYVTHKEVNNYLEKYATDFDLYKNISFGSTVTQLTILDNSEAKKSNGDDSDTSCSKIELTWKVNTEGNDEVTTTEKFDAVLICNGHYAAPSIPDVPGLKEHFAGELMHSIQYDDPNKYAGKTVLCVGGRASGSDLAREISQVAEKVYLSDSTCSVWSVADGADEKKIEEEDALGKNAEQKQCGNVIWVPRTESVEEGSVIHFGGGCTVTPKDVDVIIFCSGYDYNFPFINEKSNLDFQCVPGERRVSPLYEQLWHAQHTNLAFIGLPHSVVPFPLFELQAEAIAAQLFGENSSADPIPALVSDRMEEALMDKEKGGPDGGRVQDTHFLGRHQWDYCRLMAKRGGVYNEEVENYIATNKAIYDHAGTERKALFPGGPDTYRSTRYKRRNSNQSFEVLSSKIEEANAVSV